MKAQLMGMLVQVLMMMLTPDRLKEFADMTLDFIEEKVLGSASTTDDRFVLPVCQQIRVAFDIPDKD